MSPGSAYDRRVTRTPVAAIGLLIVLALAALDAHWTHHPVVSAGNVLRLAVVVAGVAFALMAGRMVRRLELDRRRFRTLSRAAAISDVSGTVQDTVVRLSDLLVPELADIGVIDVVRGEDVHRLAVVAHGPRAEEIEAGLRHRAASARTAPLLGLPSLRSGEPLLIARQADELAVAAAHDEEDLAFLRSLEARSTIVVPLRARGRSIGGMALTVTAESGRRYDEEDLEFIQVLSGRVALALDNAGLFSELETLEAQQTAALGSLAEAVTIQNAAGELVYVNQAAARALGFASPEELLATPPRDIVDTYDSYHEDGSPLRLEELPGRRVLAGQEAPPLLVRAINRQTGEERWRVTKATAVRDADGRPRLAVNVIEDVTEVKHAEIAQSLLAEAGRLLASSLDYEETLAQVARLAVPRLADWCGVTIPDERGVLRSVAIAHVDPERVSFAADYSRRYPARVDDEGGAAQVLRDGISQVLNEIPDELLERGVADPVQREELRSLQMRALMIVPMVAPARGVIGALSFVSAESGRTFSSADLELAEELGRRAGTAVENARLYTERSNIARTLQAGLLPDALPDMPGFAVASMYRPAGEENFVGGDFYDAFAAGDGWMLVVGDITGRGAQAAALTAQARHTLRTAGALLADPVRAVEVLNHALTARADLSICTVALVHLREGPDATTASIVAAGHPRPLLLRDGRVGEVHAWGPMVGAWRDGAWRAETIELAPGDVLVLYTDGVTDACGEGGRFGEDRLLETLRGAAGAEGAVDAVRAALRDFERGPQADDTAMVAVQRLPARVRAGGGC